jgi:hypothetical protein
MENSTSVCIKYDQKSYSLHKQMKRQFQRNNVKSAGKIMADLIGMV